MSKEEEASSLTERRATDHKVPNLSIQYWERTLPSPLVQQEELGRHRALLTRLEACRSEV